MKFVYNSCMQVRVSNKFSTYCLYNGVEVFLQAVLHVQKCRGLLIPSTNFNLLSLLLVLNRTHFKNIKKPPELNTYA